MQGWNLSRGDEVCAAIKGNQPVPAIGTTGVQEMTSMARTKVKKMTRR